MPGGIHVVGMVGEAEDQLYAAIDLHIENVRSQPLYLTGVAPKVVLAGGTDAEVTVVTPRDIPRITPSFPELAPLLTKPLPSDVMVAAHGSVDGTILLLLPGQTEAAWKSKQSAQLTLLLANGDSKIVKLP